MLRGMETERSLLTAVALSLLASISVGSDSRSCPDPTNYCSTSPNSVGAGAIISWTGTASLTADDFHLVAAGCPPGQFLMYYYGARQIALPFGNGWQCAGTGGVGIFRFRPMPIDSAGAAVMKVDFVEPPAGIGGGAGKWMPGDTWFCQGWYRDPAGGGAQFNLTDGLAVEVCPGSGEHPGMAAVPAGSFEMGDHHGVGGTDELPVHAVALDAFDIDVFLASNQNYADYLNAAHAEGRVTVTSDKVYQVGGAGVLLCRTADDWGYSSITWNGSSFGVTAGMEDHAMVEVSWYGACTFANARSRDHELTPCYDEMTWDCDFAADGYRLPTEAEWEYAARGGKHSPYFKYPWGDGINGSKANYNGSGDEFEDHSPETTPVGYYDGDQVPSGVDMANGYGLYDMAGNVWEMCWDRYDADYYSNSPPSNPTGPASGFNGVMRGGSCSMNPPALRSAERRYFNQPNPGNSMGFRLVAARR
jgi:formylglycine-generating enzyme required for sulfatase activity